MAQNINIEALRRHLIEATGATAIGFARAGSVAHADPEADLRYRQWLADGKHGAMGYLARNLDVRDNPAMLLPGANTVIVGAFNYLHADPEGMSTKYRIARYGRGADYHAVVRERMSRAADIVKATCGGDTRLCVDTAPLRERWWAVRAGIGFIGRNNTLIIPGKGSWHFLGLLLATATLDVDAPCTLTCDGCNACINACPAKALSPDGSALDARKCLSSLSIEHRGDLPAGTHLRGRLAGCDTCQEVCPHNRLAPPSALEEFAPTNPLLAMSDSDIEALGPGEIKSAIKHTALERIKPADMMRNIRNIKDI